MNHAVAQRGREAANRAVLNEPSTASILEVDLLPEHRSTVNETASYYKKPKTVQDACRRIQIMINWIKDAGYNDYFNFGVVALSPEQMADKSRYHNQTHDFRYDVINPDIIIAFLSQKKLNPNKMNSDGRHLHYSFTHLRKFKDAILTGAERANVPLSSKFHLEMKKHFASIKKETVSAKKKGELDEKEADPITYELLHFINKTMIQKGDLFSWAFGTCQWHCMARSVNIDDLSFGMISMGTDSMVVNYSDSKSDQKGEKVTPKNCFANPFDHVVCIFTALGCYLSVNNGRWSRSRFTIFRNAETRPGSASSKYCQHIQSIYNESKDVFEEYVRENHFSIHGVRKGAAILGSSGTTMPASLSAIANRGEWSVSVMFDIYLGFAEPGDCYLGRILAGLSPNKTNFDAIPPHFTVGMENRYIKEAMELCFKCILENVELISNVRALLLRCLASIVHHAEALMNIIREADGNHPLAAVAIFGRPELLVELKKLVTMEPSDKIRFPTGIPPFVEQGRKIDMLLELVIADRTERNKQLEDLLSKVKETVSDKIEEVAVQNGTVSRASVERILEDRLSAHNSILVSSFNNRIDEVLDSLRKSRVGNTDDSVPSFTSKTSLTGHQKEVETGSPYVLYTYEGKLWHVPHDFNFPPKVDRRKAWELWLCGVTDTNNNVIRPFRLLKPNLLPKSVKSKFKTQWQPVLIKMQEGLPENMQLPNNGRDVDVSLISSTFDVATNYLKTKVCSYLWEKKGHLLNKWSVATWSSTIQRANIMKHGNMNDISNLPPEKVTNFNRKKQRVS